MQSGKIMAHLFPVKWNKMTADEGDIRWVGGKDEAKATIDGGKTAEVVLKRFPRDDKHARRDQESQILGSAAQRWFHYHAQRRGGLSQGRQDLRIQGH